MSEKDDIFVLNFTGNSPYVLGVLDEEKTDIAHNIIIYHPRDISYRKKQDGLFGKDYYQEKSRQDVKVIYDKGCLVIHPRSSGFSGDRDFYIITTPEFEGRIGSLVWASIWAKTINDLTKELVVLRESIEKLRQINAEDDITKEEMQEAIKRALGIAKLQNPEKFLNQPDDPNNNQNGGKKP